MYSLHPQGPRRDLEGGAVAAVDDDRLPVEAATTERGDEVGDVVGGGAEDGRAPARPSGPSGPSPAPASTRRRSSTSMRCSGRSVILRPPRANNFTPLSGYGLWLAEITTAKACRTTAPGTPPRASGARRRAPRPRPRCTGRRRVRLRAAAQATRVAPDDERPVGAQHSGGGAVEGGHELGCEIAIRDPANSVGAELQRHGAAQATQRFEYCGALRAFLRPYLRRSFSRASRLSSPAFFNVGRSSSSRETRARAIPRRKRPLDRSRPHRRGRPRRRTRQRSA